MFIIVHHFLKEGVLVFKYKQWNHHKSFEMSVILFIYN